MAKYSKPAGAAYSIVTLLKMAVASFVAAFGFNKFLLRNSITPGGFSGISAVVELSTGFSAGLFGIILNLPFFLLSRRRMDKRFFLFSVAGTLMYSGALELVKLIPVEITMQNSLLYALAGGIMLGAGFGYIVRIGYSTGGSELLATLINKRLPAVKIGGVTAAINALVIVLNAVFVGKNLELIILSAVTMFLSSKMIDLLVDGFKAAKAYYIISGNFDELSEKIMGELNRSCTVFTGEGSRLRTKQRMLMCIVTNSEVARLRYLVLRVDSHAFMFSTSVKEAYGTGFAENKPPIRLPKLHISKKTPNIKREIKINK
jgi:uncharacterized membrane-anchored protein YitT (DUF2179 family)